MNILFVTSEAHPLIKTGGLADVCGALPTALRREGVAVRLVLPAYPIARNRAEPLKLRATLTLYDQPVQILEGRMPDSDTPIWLVAAPCFDRPGHPYLTPEGHDWPDNALRFALLSRAAIEIAQNRLGLAWRPDLIHCHDWQTGLVPALLSQEWQRPATLFTIHNLAYQGRFSAETRHSLWLPERLWSLHGLEFHGGLNLIKGGLAFADHITTVSPTYAREILQPSHAYGLEGLLQNRQFLLSGILNGIDDHEWDPAHDTRLEANYQRGDLAGKAICKQRLQQEMGLHLDATAPLFGFIGRLVDQKGVDLILAAMPTLLVESNLQLVILGSGEHHLQEGLRQLAAAWPSRVALYLGYDEGLSHRIEAGCDTFLMPSRFEPCGLNQLYSLRYGTLPIVHRTGGLADTVSAAPADRIEAGEATGFMFNNADQWGLLWACRQAITYYQQPAIWQQMIDNAMAQEFSWQSSARSYIELYQRLVHH
jgi:starch synthase